MASSARGFPRAAAARLAVKAGVPGHDPFGLAPDEGAYEPPLGVRIAPQLRGAAEEALVICVGPGARDRCSERCGRFSAATLEHGLDEGR